MQPILTNLRPIPSPTRELALMRSRQTARISATKLIEVFPVRPQTRVMKITDDLHDAKWMYFKAFLFGVIGVVCVLALLIEYSNWRDAALLLLAIWAWCRLYYFAFYVIEKYIDPSFKFAGLSSVLVYWWKRK